MQLSQTEQEIVRELASTFRRQFGASEVLLYGSAARGELEEDSDIDLLLVLPEVTWEIEKQIIAHCFQAELKCARIIFTVCFSQKELRETPLRRSPLVVKARREGIAL